jgi:hypothetical protein
MSFRLTRPPTRIPALLCRPARHCSNGRRLNQQNSPALLQFQICLVSWRLFAVRARAPSCSPEPHRTFLFFLPFTIVPRCEREELTGARVLRGGCSWLRANSGGSGRSYCPSLFRPSGDRGAGHQALSSRASLLRCSRKLRASTMHRRGMPCQRPPRLATRSISEKRGDAGCGRPPASICVVAIRVWMP